MQPGDIIFYSAKYYNPRGLQKHDMVHVEVFLGGETGESSVGSRASFGSVAIHDSYKFESKFYHSIEYHYRSLETWLEGICRSWCSLHAWQPQRFCVTPGNNHEMVTKLLIKEMGEM